MRNLILTASLLASLAGGAQAAEYHFDSNAAGAGNGTLATPFKSLSSMPTLASGDVVKLARGSEWEDASIAVREQVTIESYGAPGLAPPVLTGSRLRLWSDSGLNASETLQDPNDPDSGVITLHTPAGTTVYGAFINEKFPIYLTDTDSNGSLDCTSANAAKRVTPRYWFANYTTKICRASLPTDVAVIDRVRLVTRERIIDLAFTSSNILDTAKYIKIAGLDLRHASSAGIGGAQNVSGLNYGRIYIENNDFYGMIKTGVCLCTGSVSSDSEYATKGDKFEKLKVSGNRFYANGLEAVYIGPSNSSPGTDALPIEIVDNIFGEENAALLDANKKFLISGWYFNTNAGAEGVDIKRGNKAALVARNVFRLNMKKASIFIQSFGVEVSRNTINNLYVPGKDKYSKLSDTHNSAIWHQFEPPPTTTDGGEGEVTENSISNGVGSGVLFRGANGILATLDSQRNQIHLVDDGSCADCYGYVDGNSAFVVRAKVNYGFSLTGNVARGGTFAVHRFEEVNIAPSYDGDRFRGKPLNSAYCITNLTPGSLSSPVCIAGVQDTDLDGVSDFEDNCPAVANASQVDTDVNQIGDACDLAWQTNDVDGDGIYNTEDSCPSVANGDQDDDNENGIGDACEGLFAEYFNDVDTNNSNTITALDDKLVGPAVLTRIDPAVDFDWQFASPGSGVNAEYFSARWTGRLIVPAYTGTYEFCVKGDDGVRLWVNGTQLLDFWVPQDSVKNCASIALVAGQTVPIKVEFFDLTEEAIVQLTWSWPGQVAQVVPASSLYAQ